MGSKNNNKKQRLMDERSIESARPNMFFIIRIKKSNIKEHFMFSCFESTYGYGIPINY